MKIDRDFKLSFENNDDNNPLLIGITDFDTVDIVDLYGSVTVSVSIDVWKKLAAFIEEISRE